MGLLLRFETAKPPTPHLPAVYPYRTRTRWLLAGRYAHLAMAVNSRRAGLQDSVLERRVQALERWNAVRAVLLVLLSLGVVAAILSSAARALPGGIADDVIGGLLAASAALAGVLTLATVLVTRLLGQLEIDILALLLLDHRR
jgi:hypothetical protein